MRVNVSLFLSLTLNRLSVKRIRNFCVMYVHVERYYVCMCMYAKVSHTRAFKKHTIRFSYTSLCLRECVRVYDVVWLIVIVVAKHSIKMISFFSLLSDFVSSVCVRLLVLVERIVVLLLFDAVVPLLCTTNRLLSVCLCVYICPCLFLYGLLSIFNRFFFSILSTHICVCACVCE